MSPLHLVVLGFCLLPLSGTFSFVISFYLTFFDCGFYFVGCRFVVLAFAVCPLVDEVVLRDSCRVPGGKGLFLPTVELNWIFFSPLVCRASFRKTFKSLSADGQGCIPSLLVAWPETPQHGSLQSTGWVG